MYMIMQTSTKFHCTTGPLCDVRFIYRDTHGTHREWQFADQNDMMNVIKYSDVTWLVCQNLFTGEWAYWHGNAKKWRPLSCRMVAQILTDYKSNVPSDRMFINKFQRGQFTSAELLDYYKFWTNCGIGHWAK